MRSARRDLVALVASATATALLAGLAIASPGLSGETPTPADGAVWVANGAEGLVGRLTPANQAIDTVVTTLVQTPEIVQTSNDVLVIDHGTSSIRVVDRATGEMTDPIPIPADATILANDDTLVVSDAATGDVWILPSDEIANYRVTSEPDLELGEGGHVVLSQSGTIFAVSEGLRRVLTIDPATGETIASDEVGMAQSDPDVVISAVGERWVVLDRASGLLSSEGWTASLTDARGAVLQTPGPAGDEVLVSFRDRLEILPFDGGTPTVVSGIEPGSAAEPVVVGNCAYAAWASGNAWRRCGGLTRVLPLDGMSPQAQLTFAERDDVVVLTSAQFGVSWLVEDRGQRVDDWGIEEEDPDAPTTDEHSDEIDVVTVEPDPQPPVAVDDDLGARQGSTTLLPVLLNDWDPNGDALLVTEASVPDDTEGIVAAVAADGKGVLLTVAEGITGTVAVSYTISDGASSASATAHVTLRTPDENSPPVQVVTSTATAGQSGTITTNVLADFVDPDGDPIVLTSASGLDDVVYRADGTVHFTDIHGEASAVRDIGLVVTDGREPGEGTLQVTILDTPTAPLVANPIALTGHVGQPLQVSPLLWVRGGTDPRLHTLPAIPGMLVSIDAVDQSVTLIPEQSGLQRLEYSVTDGEQLATGVIWIDVRDAVDASTPPVTVPHIAGVIELGTVDIDVTATDRDPSGSVLLVTDVSVPYESPVRADVIDQHRLRVTLTGPLDGPVVVHYTVSNGVASAAGTLTVVELSGTALQAPIAHPDAADAQPGQAIDIDVLRNDEHPDGAQLRLAPDLVSDVAAGGGLLFTSGGILRYVAPETPGTYSAVYEVVGPDGQTAQSSVTIVVAEASPTGNQPPQPPLIEAHVVAGESVRIPIGLAGIDPNGDTVQLIGESSAPGRGTITDRGMDWLEFTAGAYATGTDEFTYEVIDAFGARATGIIRIGIVDASAIPGGPTAAPDDVSVRPATDISIPVTENDADAMGSTLTVIDAVTNDDAIDVSFDAGHVIVRVPDVEGEFGIMYTVENARGQTAVAWVRLTVSEDAPLPRPAVTDVSVPLAAILDEQTVTVDPLVGATVADGGVDTLDVVLPLDLDGVQTTPDGIEIEIQDRSRIVPFTVVRSDDQTVGQTALIFVPGREDSLPQLNPLAEPIIAEGSGPVVIDVNDVVIAAHGGEVYIADASSVQATHANGAPLVRDDQTIVYQAMEGYFGPASIQFEVTDGRSPSDPNGRRSMIVLPITVQPTETQPPTLANSIIQMEPGGERTLDLARLTQFAGDIDEVQYAVTSVTQGMSATLNGRILDLRVDPGTTAGSTLLIQLVVQGADGARTTGTLTVQIVTSTRPLVAPIADALVVDRGGSGTLDVLANDEATNPFPGQPLTVIGFRGLDGALPEGLSVTIGADGQTLVVSASPNAVVGTVRIQYQVVDVTGAPSRAVWGTATVSVRDVPSQPIAPTLADVPFAEGSVTIQITPPADNNSPITGYRIVGEGYSANCGLTLLCPLTDLPAGVPMRLQVIATNAVGDSLPSPVSAPITRDFLPAAPATVTAQPTSANPNGGALSVSWSAVPNPPSGSPIVRYIVRVTGPGVAEEYTVSVGTTTLEIPNTAGTIVPGQRYRVQVFAQNSAPAAATDWRATGVDVVAVGPPAQVAPIAVSRSGDNITLSWNPPTTSGASVLSTVTRYRPGEAPTTCMVGTGGSAVSSWTDTGVPRGETFVYAITNDNGYYCTVTVSQPVASVPATPTGGLALQASADDTVDVLVTPQGATPSGVTYQVSVDGGAWFALPADGIVTGPVFGTAYDGPVGVQLRACRDSVCGSAANLGTITPLRLAAQVQACTLGQPLQVTLHDNPGAIESAVVTFRGPNGWTNELPLDGLSVPINAIEVRVTGIVTSGGATWRDPIPTIAPCGL